MTQLLAHLFGDYILQSDWMAQNKTKANWPAFCHALLYSLCFLWLCWMPSYMTVHTPPCVTYLDSRGSETTCVSEGLRIPANATGFNVYAVSPPVDILHSAHFRWLPWLVIFSTHFLIDRFRIARYVVWAKNWLGPLYERVPIRYSQGLQVPVIVAHHWRRKNPTPALSECPTGYPPTTPPWLSTWLLIVADNTLHLAINYAVLRWL